MNVLWTTTESSLLFLQVFVLDIFIRMTDAYALDNAGCDELNGVCTETYNGCLGGSFERGLCAGPIYMQCCVLPEVEEVYIAPWRYCYSCEHTVSNGYKSGPVECMDEYWVRGHEDILVSVPDMPRVNCTGACKKEWIELDDHTYAIERGCEVECRPLGTVKGLIRSCCHEELCNLATRQLTSTGTLVSSLFATFVAVTLLCQTDN